MLLYMSLSSSINKVQIRQESCYNNDKRPYCTCGVAVRVGGDVFVIDRCSKDYAKKVKHTLCMHRHLSVHKKSNSKYIVSLLTHIDYLYLF